MRISLHPAKCGVIAMLGQAKQADKNEPNPIICQKS
jgi:hypothetical protein